MIDRGVRCSNTPVPAPPVPAAGLAACTAGAIQAPSLAVTASQQGGQFGDYDGQYRPMRRIVPFVNANPRFRTPWISEPTSCSACRPPCAMNGSTAKSR